MKNVLILSLFIMLSCGTSKDVSVLNKREALPIGSAVEIIGLGQKAPDGAKLIGQVKVGDSGLTIHCNYQTVIADAVELTRKMGGNLFQITEHREPDIHKGSCHMVAGDVYFVQK